MRRSMIAALSALVLAVSQSGQPGLATQPADGGYSTEGQSPASAEIGDVVTNDAAEAAGPDLEAVREANGWTMDQIAAYEAAEAALDAVTERLSTDYPHAFVGSALADEPTETPTYM